MMKKIVLVLSFISSLMMFAGCGAQPTDILAITGAVQPMYSTSYSIVPLPSSQETVYGTVIADSIKTISVNRAGVLDYLNCQPGMQVHMDTIIAKIQPNDADPTYQNGQIQLDALDGQITTMTSIFSLTDDNFSLQKNILYKQYDTNQQLLANLAKSQGYSDSSLAYQQDLLHQQYASLQDMQSMDLTKIKTNISTAHQQYVVMVSDALKKVDDVFGITNKDKNSAFDQYVSSKDTSLRTQVNQQYPVLQNKLSLSMYSTDFSQYLLDAANFMTLAAKSIAASAPSSSLPQSSPSGISIDGLYTTYTTLATTFLTAKSAFDMLASSYDSVSANYQNQITTVATNTANFQNNTAESTKLQLDNQVLNLQLAQQSLQTQIDSLDNTRSIQLDTLKNQLITLKQNASILNNTLDGETLYAGMEGVVKARLLGEDNKVASNTQICQITPQQEGNLSIQVFSYQKLSRGTRVGIWRNASQFVGTGIILFEYPYKDPTTQNYIYEIPVVDFDLKENEKLLITSSQAVDTTQVWIPLSYVSPRLEGNLVQRKVNTQIQSISVTLGNINGSYVQVLSGLSLGNQIVQ